MAKTDDSELYQQFLMNYIEDIKKQIDQDQIELVKQADLWISIPSVSFDQLNNCLKEFVHCQRHYLSTRNNHQLTKFKDDMRESALFEIITTYYPTMDQVSITNSF